LDGYVGEYGVMHFRGYEMKKFIFYSFGRSIFNMPWVANDPCNGDFSCGGDNVDGFDVA